MALKVWNGTAFVDAPPKIWNGTAFVAPTKCHIWNGTAFVEVWSNVATPVAHGVRGTIGTFQSGGPVVPVKLPVERQVGDLVLLYSYRAGSTAALATPAGWKQEFGSVYGASRTTVFTRVMDGSEGPTVSIEMGTSRNLVGAVAIKDTEGIDSVAVSSTTQDGTTVTTPSINAKSYGGIILRAVISGGASSTSDHTWPAGQTEILDFKPPENTDQISMGYAFKEVPGETGTAQVTGIVFGPRAWMTVGFIPKRTAPRYWPSPTVLYESGQVAVYSDLAVLGWEDRAYGTGIFEVGNYTFNSAGTADRPMNAYRNTKADLGQNHWAKYEIAVPPTSYTQGLALRMDTTQAVILRLSATTWDIRSGTTNGTATGTVLASGTHGRTLIPGDIVWATVNGDRCELWVNDAFIGGYTGTLPAGTFAGLAFSRKEGGEVRFWEAGTL